VIVVTAAIPTYNRARFLPGALDSVLAQTRPPDDVLVVDDGSTDETTEVLERYPAVRVVRQDNQGRSEARNTAVREAYGRFVSFLDSDDRWVPDKLERELPVLEADLTIGLVHGHVDLIGPGDEPLPDETRRHHELFSAAHRNGVTYAGYAFDCRCFSSAVTVRKQAVEEVGFYDPDLLLDDYDLYLRLALAWKIVFLEGQAVALYRRHQDQMTTYELTMGQIQTAEKHLRLLDERDDLPDAELARRNFELMLARSWAVLGDQKASRRHLLRALRLDRGLLRESWIVRRLVGSTLKR
jgi:glycosyltransferase involved in cell wall biosynthesis